MNIEQARLNIRKLDAEVTEYVDFVLDEELPVSPHTLKTYAYALVRLKQICGCSLKDFGDDAKSQVLWKLFKKKVKDEDYSIRYSNVIVSALYHFSMVNKITLPPYVAHFNDKTVSSGALKKQGNRERHLQELVEFFVKNPLDLKRIFTADLSGVCKNRFMQDKVRFATIEFLYTGKRISEVVESRVSDVYSMREGGKSYRGLWVYSEKTKKRFQKLILEDTYWSAREKYLGILAKRKYDGDLLFPGLSKERLSQLIGGWQSVRWVKVNGQVMRKVVKHPGVAEVVWGGRVWSHVFRHSRLTELAGVLPVEALQVWAGHTHIGTTVKYVSDVKKRRLILESLVKKPADGWN